MQQLQEEIKQNEESQTLKKKEAHPIDAKSFNKPKRARKKQENTLLQELSGKQLIEAALILRLKKGNEKAYTELYQLYYSDLCNYASNLCGSDDLAEDIVQHQ
jgi:DNA-directed RNA polymerase specialized sigma24 family protein